MLGWNPPSTSDEGAPNCFRFGDVHKEAGVDPQKPGDYSLRPNG